MNYLDFLNSKVVTALESGFDVTDDEISPALLPHQRESVKWAVKGGCRALFESFGLGKTVQELEYCRLVTAKEGGQALIILPLGVKQEFTRDAVELLHIEAPTYITCQADADKCSNPIMMTNYERVRDGDINPERFIATVLDEAAVLRFSVVKHIRLFYRSLKM